MAKIVKIGGTVYIEDPADPGTGKRGRRVKAVIVKGPQDRQIAIGNFLIAFATRFKVCIKRKHK